MSRKVDLCEDPNNPADGTFFAGADPSLVSPISAPDNITFDGKGNLGGSGHGTDLTQLTSFSHKRHLNVTLEVSP